jgi:prolyl oligopeptidase
MLRSETTQNGQYNATEYGSVKDPEQFKALYAYSPYHHVEDGVKYPAVLLTVGENDPRVDPWHSRKFAAGAASGDGFEISGAVAQLLQCWTWRHRLVRGSAH